MKDVACPEVLFVAPGNEIDLLVPFKKKESISLEHPKLFVA